MPRKQPLLFSPTIFLSKIGPGKSLLRTNKLQLIFSQGDAAEAVFYIQTGQVKLTVLSEKAKKPSSRCWSLGAFSGKDVSPDS